MADVIAIENNSLRRTRRNKKLKNKNLSTQETSKTTLVPMKLKQKESIEKNPENSLQTANSLEYFLHDIRFIYFNNESRQIQEEILKLLINTPITETVYLEIMKYIRQHDSNNLITYLNTHTVNEEELIGKLSKMIKGKVEKTKDLDKVLALYFEEEDQKSSFNLLRYLIFSEFQSTEEFELWYKWFSSLTPEQKRMNIPTYIWNAYTI